MRKFFLAVVIAFVALAMASDDGWARGRIFGRIFHGRQARTSSGQGSCSTGSCGQAPAQGSQCGPAGCVAPLSPEGLKMPAPRTPKPRGTSWRPRASVPAIAAGSANCAGGCECGCSIGLGCTCARLP